MVKIRIDAPKEILPIASLNEDYAEKVIEIMKNSELRNSMAKQSREFIIQNFSWNIIRNDLSDILEVSNA